MTMNIPNQSCLDNHHTFRLLLQAMSRPGLVFQLPEPSADARQAMLSLLASLLDPQVSYCLLEADPALEQQLQRLTGARAAAAPEADFLLAPGGSSHGQLPSAKRGRMEFPDQGATILFAVERLGQGCATTGLELSGPGIKERIYPEVLGLDGQDLAWLREINSAYPLGVDSIFVDGLGQLLCLPRSTRIRGD